MAGVTGEFVREHPTGEPVELVVKGGAGDVVVWASVAGRTVVRGEFSVRAVPRSRAERLAQLIRESPPVEVRGREVRVGDLSRYTEELGPGILGKAFEEIHIDYEIQVPPATEARIEAEGGDVEISGIRGPVEVRTGSGDVAVEGIGGDVEIGTGSGDARARDVGGDFRAHTGSGDVSAEGIRGDVEIATGSGHIAVRSISGDLTATAGSGDIVIERVGSDVEARTGSGDIRVDSSIGPRAIWRFRTGSGDVHLSLPEGAEFRLVAETNFGEVHSDFPDHPDAPAAIEVKTGSGDIRVEKEKGGEDEAL